MPKETTRVKPTQTAQPKSIEELLRGASGEKKVVLEEVARMANLLNAYCLMHRVEGFTTNKAHCAGHIGQVTFERVRE